MRTPPLPTMPSREYRTSEAGALPITSLAASVARRGAASVAPASLPAKPLYLVWDNSNHTNLWPVMVCEIHSTKSLTQSFKPYATVSCLTNALPFWPTNAAEFFIARFAQTNLNPWLYSEWAHH